METDYMELEAYLKKTADEVNSLLQSCYGDPKTELSQAANHLLFAGRFATQHNSSSTPEPGWPSESD